MSYVEKMERTYWNARAPLSLRILCGRPHLSTPTIDKIYNGLEAAAAVLMVMAKPNPLLDALNLLNIIKLL